jgi:hypothetical protein
MDSRLDALNLAGLLKKVYLAPDATNGDISRSLYIAFEKFEPFKASSEGWRVLIPGVAGPGSSRYLGVLSVGPNIDMAVLER